MRMVIVSATLMVLSLSGCAHRAPPAMCSFGEDAAGIISDRDIARHDIDQDRYQYVRESVLRDANYPSVQAAIARANVNSDSRITAIYGTPEDDDFRIVHVAITRGNCEARFVRARSGDVAFDIVEGSGRLKSCEIPAYILSPLAAVQRVQPNPQVTISHPTARFLLWEQGGRRCGSVVDGASHLTWWIELTRLSFLETLS